MADLPGLMRDLLAVVHRRGGATHESVADALLTVPRHLFVPGAPLTEAYRDDAIVTKRDSDGVPVSSSSQPTIMAIMLDQLEVAPGHRVLEIGAGTGYNAALLAHLVGPAGAVVSLDIDARVVDRARDCLAAAGYPQVAVVCADGAYGWMAAAPYDRIIVTAGVWDLAPAWLDQLAPDGRLVVPLDLHGAQVSAAFERENGHWVSRSQFPCGFMRLRGDFAGPGRIHVLDRANGLRLAVPDDRDIDDDQVSRALAGPASSRPTGVSGSHMDECGDLAVWLAITEPRSCGLSDEATDSGVLESALMQAHGFRATACILDAASIAVLGRRVVDNGFELYSHGYGSDRDRIATELAATVQAWDSAGRPSAAQLRIAAYPRDTPAPERGIVLTKANTRLHISIES